jgi:hypothetical protein
MKNHAPSAPTHSNRRKREERTRTYFHINCPEYRRWICCFRPSSMRCLSIKQSSTTVYVSII